MYKLYPYRPFTLKDLIPLVADALDIDKAKVRQVVDWETKQLHKYAKDPSGHSSYYLSNLFSLRPRAHKLRRMIRKFIRRMRRMQYKGTTDENRYKYYASMVDFLFKIRHAVYAYETRKFKDYNAKDHFKGRTKRQMENALEQQYFNFCRTNRGKYWKYNTIEN